MIGGGCEPYSFDFGDREYVAWLRKHLSATELAERERRWKVHVRWHAWPIRVDHGLWWAGRGRGLWQWPMYLWTRRRVYRFDRLARERGGPPPGPTWKIRHEFGMPSGGSGTEAR